MLASDTHPHLQLQHHIAAHDHHTVPGLIGPSAARHAGMLLKAEAVDANLAIVMEREIAGDLLDRADPANSHAAQLTDISKSGQSGLTAIGVAEVEDKSGPGDAYKSNVEERDASGTLVNSVTAIKSAAQWMAI